MNHWGSGWLLAAVSVAAVACGNASDGNPAAQAGAAGSGVNAGQGGSPEAGMSGSSSNRGGSAGSSGGGQSGSAGSAGKSGAGGEHSGGASGGGGSGGSAASGGSGGSSGAGGAAHPSDVLMPLVKAFCAAARACCTAENLPTDLDHCESSFMDKDPTFAALNKGTASIDQAGLSACLTAYQQAATKCEEYPVLTACQGLLHGTQKEQEKCVNVDECAHAAGEAVACMIPGQATEGVCAKVTRGKLGDSCLLTCGTGEDCEFTSYGATETTSTYCFEQDGLLCSLDNNKCVAIPALGAPCTFDDCGSANYCDTTCKKRGGLGEACGQSCLSSFQCINDQCRSPSFTVGSTCSGQWYGPY